MYCGIDFPYLLYKVSLGECVNTIENYKIGVWYIHLLKDSLAVFKTLQTTKSIEVFYNILKSYTRVKTFCTISLDDPLPIFKKTLINIRKILASKQK